MEFGNLKKIVKQACSRTDYLKTGGYSLYVERQYNF